MLIDKYKNLVELDVLRYFCWASIKLGAWGIFMLPPELMPAPVPN